MVQGSFGFPPELRTPPLPATHAEGGASPSSTCLRLRTRHLAGPPICESTRTCDLVSQFLFGVDAQDGQSGRGEDGPLHGNVVELLLTVSVVRGSLDLLGVDL